MLRYREICLWLLLGLSPVLCQSFHPEDKHALEATKKVETSVRALARYLQNGRPKSIWDRRVRFWIRNRSGEVSTSREIYRWVTDRIEYDDSEATKVFPEDVLAVRRTNCEGYARLYEALSKEAELDCVYCSGMTSEGYHAWNAVRIGGDWLMVDCCWGAGKKDFDSQWFLVPPKRFIQTHSPDKYKLSEFRCYDFLLKPPQLKR